jgi:hypothetical protein
VNAQELFLDVSSGRFLDGATAIPTQKPVFFSDEQRDITLTTLKVRANQVSAVTPSGNSRFKIRMGTQALKLVDGLAVSTAQPNLITAAGSVVTISSTQAIGSSSITTYSPVTATLLANVVTFPVVTAGFIASVNFVAPVTATVTLGIGSITLPAVQIGFPANLSGITDVIRPSIRGKVLSLTATLNTPAAAIFASAISGGSVLTVARVSFGSGYPDGSYPLSFSSPNPTAATFTATVSGGVVTTISIVTGGSGYGVGPFDLVFSATTGTIAAATASSLNGSINSITITDGGSDYASAPNVTLATAPAVTASATAIASGDQITSITLVNGGSGYSIAPTVTLFTPAKRVVAVEPTSKISNVVSGSIFSWASGLSTSATVGLLFSSPDNLITPALSSVPSAFIYFQSGNTWKLQLISSGYGYTTAPTVIHNDVLVYDNTTEYAVVPKITQIGSTRSQTPSPSFMETTIGAIQKKPATSSGILLSSGGIFPELILGLNLFESSNIFGLQAVYNFRSAQRYAPTSLMRQIQATSEIGRQRGFSLAAQAQIPLVPQRANIFTIANEVTTGEARLLGARYPNELFPTPGNPSLVVRVLDLKHDQFAGRQFLAVLDTFTSEKPTRFAVCQITIPPTSTYDFLQNGLDPTSVNWPNDALWVSQKGGGILETKIQFLDYGAGYTDAMTRGGFRLVEVSSLATQNDFLESPAERTVTAITSYELGGFANNSFARAASASTRPGQRGVKYFLSDGGLGYYKASVVSIGATSVSGGVITASITNQPSNYIDGNYAISIATAPGLGTTAQVSLVVSAGNFSAVILDTGLGYTTSPIATAPAPNFISGQLSALGIVTRPQGYSINIPHPINISQSPISGGNAEAIFTISDSGEITTNIKNAGFGYSTAPSASGLDPDLRNQNGFVGSIQLSNQPEGYVVGREYPLTVQQSPSPLGTARAIIVRTDASRYNVSVLCRGFGYTSAPSVLAVAPDQLQGVVNYVSTSTFGRGYSPGQYQCSVSNAPNGGETAEISFVVDSPKSARFVVEKAGYGYTTAPLVSVPTPAGNLISSISITCAGSFYNQSTATFSILDSAGDGAEFSTVISSGTINAVQVLNSGYGFSQNPAIAFSSPIAPPQEFLDENQVKVSFNITTASANAILSTATQRDILMEVYETDGTNEQVVAQATVSLAKRVLE